MKGSNDINLVEKVLDKKYNIDKYLEIYNKMRDEKSRNILFNRVMYDNTKQIKYAMDMIKNMYYSSTFNSKADRVMYKYISFLQKNENYNKKICFFGLGFNKNNKESLMWEFLTLVGQCDNGLNIDAIYNDDYGFEVDLYLKKKLVQNIDEFYNMVIDNDKIYVIIESRYNFIENYLCECGVSSDNIFKFNNEIIFTRERQYFDEVFLNYTDNEIF